MEQLNEEQVEAFDKEYVNNNRWVPIKRCIDRDFPDGQFSFLDLGGGNGLFADRMLASYPKSTGVVLDNSPLLLDRNRPSARKRVVLGSVENLACMDLTKYDLVFFNWVLHHLVSRSFARSCENIDGALRSVMALLTERGRVSISENMYNGLVIDGLPGWLVYQLTSAKIISWLTKKGGANTAGVGVCFRSYSEWCSTVQRIGFRILDFTNDDAWQIPWTWNAFLHIGHIRCGHFWLSLQ